MKKKRKAHLFPFIIYHIIIERDPDPINKQKKKTVAKAQANKQTQYMRILPHLTTDQDN